MPTTPSSAPGARRRPSAQEAIEGARTRDETDEFIRPTVIGDYDGMADGDVVVHFNFRPDRGRELVMALGEPGFGEFERDPAPEVGVTTLAQFREGWPYPVAFPPHAPATTLAEVLAGEGAPQLHVAETEKYAHVTYFFNGGREAEWEGEDRRLVPSPRDVATYDEKPEMSAAGSADAFCAGWREDNARFGIINFANPDMVGHTGNVPAATAAVEAVDAALARVVDAVHSSGGACVITADHGNCEQMINPDGSPNTAHSLNLVPVIVTVAGCRVADGILADVSPTILALLGIEQPAGMTRTALVQPGA